MKSHLRDLACLGLVGPDRRGFCPIQSFSAFPLSDWFNRQRSSSSRTDSSHWTRHRGARETLSFISKGANLPHAGANVWKEKMIRLKHLIKRYSNNFYWLQSNRTVTRDTLRCSHLWSLLDFRFLKKPCNLCLLCFDTLKRNTMSMELLRH